MIKVIESKTFENFEIAKKLFEEYAAQLGFSLCFQNFSNELENISLIYSRPSGMLLLAKYGDEIVGCVGVKEFEGSVCEMKRLYIKENARNKGIGRILCKNIIEKSIALGYSWMRLDTLASMKAAQNLYRSFGFKEISPYYENPIEGAIYMELELLKKYS